MPNFNKVILMGNLTRDPELRFTGSNVAVCKIGLAINRTWTDRQSNEKKEETTFVDCTAFGRTAEVLNQYMAKGKPLMVEGRLHLNQWQDQQGQNRSKLEVIIESMQFIGGRDEGGQASQTRRATGAGNSYQQAIEQGGGSSMPIDDGDIPFAADAPVCGVI